MSIFINAGPIQVKVEDYHMTLHNAYTEANFTIPTEHISSVIEYMQRLQCHTEIPNCASVLQEIYHCEYEFGHDDKHSCCVGSTRVWWQ